MPIAFDVVIMGGAFSGASLAVLLRRELPDLSVLVIERTEQFDRKVGEATTEVSGEFLTKRLGLTSYLAHHQLPKQGLRMWFARDEETAFEDCVEVGSKFQTRLPAYQLDREKMDSHLLAMAADEGAEVWRPAKVKKIDGLRADGDAVTGGHPSSATLVVERDGEEEVVSARWVIDASGRAAVLSRKFETFRALDEHPTNAMWARFHGAADWDGHAMRTAFPEYAKAGYASRAAATNHLTGYGWWCWIIPLKGGDFSAGLVYDSRIFTPPVGDSIAARLLSHLRANPVGREIFRDAVPAEQDQKAYSRLPYFSERLAGPGWQLVGDAAGFMDPLYSPGLDYCSWTVRCAVGRIAAESRGESVEIDALNARFAESYQAWFRGLYLDKYFYLGDAELMSAAYWMDIALFFLGP
ncbi:MAG: NAD(P)/FAD-dependent oxidoreductase, partial [Chthoniobacterales bacterium]